jgi:hypothetical protein
MSDDKKIIIQYYKPASKEIPKPPRKTSPKQEVNVF